MSLDELVTDKKYSESESSSSSSSTRSTRQYPEMDDMVANYVIANLKAYGGSYHVPAFADDGEATEIPDEVCEKLGLAEGTTETLESVFGVEIEGDYIGEAGDLEASSGQVDRHATIQVQKSLNGYHSDLVEEHFPGCSVSVGVGSSTKFADDEKRNTWARIKVVDTDKAARTRWRARLDVGEISEEDYISWCVENKLDPWPRRQGADGWQEHAARMEAEGEAEAEADD